MTDEYLYTPSQIRERLDIPKENEITSVEDASGEFMYDLIRKNKIQHTLEIGFAYGKSAAYIMSASQSEHVAMDPFQDGFHNIGVQNIRKLGLEDRLTLHRDYSHVVLPQLLKEGKKFDFVFIDGDHKFDGIFIDFFYSDLLLNQGGYILFHDIWMRSTSLVESFIKNNRKDYGYIRTVGKNLSLFRKEGKDSREWMHFKEFYTLKSMMAFHATLRRLNN